MQEHAMLPVTREDLDELKDDIKALEFKVDNLSSALARIELEVAKTTAALSIKSQAEVARLELELAGYRGRASTEIGKNGVKTAIVLSILGTVGSILLAAGMTWLLRKI
jgi:hypothetical protein